MLLLPITTLVSLGLLLALPDGAAAGYCPTGCSCLQHIVRCIRARQTVVPKVPHDTGLLDLRFNHFDELPANAFADLPQLTTLFLNENEIVHLQDGTFNGLVALRFLYLNNNRISRLPPNIFQQLKHLEAIYLENNDIWEIHPNTFNNLPRLNRLFIYNNKLSSIPAEGFANLPSLTRLRLDGNPIDCNCGVYSLWHEYQQGPQHPPRQNQNQRQRNQVAIMLTCATPPKLAQRNFEALTAPDFHCRKPTLIAAPHDMHLTSGENVVLPCQVAGDPAPEIVWLQNTNEITNSYGPRMQVLAAGDLRIDAVDQHDIGIYECIARNEMGEVRTQPVRLMVEPTSHNHIEHEPVNNLNIAPPPPPSPSATRSSQLGTTALPPHFIRMPQDQTVALHSSDTIRLDCVAYGVPKPDIEWYYNGRLIGESTPSIQLLANGSLALPAPIQRNAGVYRCEASNHLGSVQATARINVKDLPEILIAPQNQTIRVGEPLVLECDADGNPTPSIAWQFNGAPLTATSGHLQLENENTELLVSVASETDAGIYTCIAANENGESNAMAYIVVEQPRNEPPQLIIEPVDLVAYAGTSIELPCKPDNNRGNDLKITWRHDGRFIEPDDARHEISTAGSLLVKNVTLFDSGRYECSVKNEYGRATASALVTIRNNIDLAPGDRFVRIAFNEAAREIDLAINNTMDTLFTNRTRTTATPNYGELLRVFRFPKGEARQLARAAEIYERTLVNIRKHVRRGDNLTIESDKFEFKDLLSREHLRLVAELSGCMEHREMPNCTDMCYHSKYRSIDGTCNNLQQPVWGASLTAFRRIEMPIYENGFSMPIGWTKTKLYAGYPKPSARLVSTTLISTKEITPDERITHMVMQWGQFLDHDLDHAIPSVSSESWDGVDCKKTCEFAPPCYPIEVPPNDPRIKNRRCIDIVRSSSICGSGMTSVFFESVQHREQINQLTSFIDASQVYGFSADFAQELRNLTTDDGLLRVGVQFPNQKPMLPFAAPQDGMDCRRNLDENTMSCFVSGDIRVNEQIGLLAMHTVWLREHNRITGKLRELNPHWDGDTLYQEARKIVGAQMQHITYEHWLPLVLGASGMRKLGAYKGYDSQINPSIANEFATVALRFGHTIINPVLERLNASFQPIREGHLPLHKAFFAPWRLPYEGGVDPLMRGMFAVPAKLKTPDQNLNTELTEKLFHTAHAVALDLAGMNIQRGRDHGIPGYNVYRKFCNLSVAENFEQLSAEISSAAVRAKLEKLYGHPDNIDVWVGGVLEDQVEGAKVGPLFQCLLVEQFRRLRDGDRFYYENPGVFLPQQLAQIKQANLARVVCDTGDHIDEVPENVFILAKHQGGYKRCEDIAGINLYFWQDCGSCSSLPPLFESYVPETYVKPSKQRTKRSSTNYGDVEDDEHRPGHDDNKLAALYDVNEERVSGLEELIGDFLKEIKKLHKKIHKLEESCGAVADTPTRSDTPLPAAKPKRNHCVDDNGTTRLNNEVWTPDVCTKCNCFRGQVACTRQKCGEVSCPNGVEPLTPPEACCPHCPPTLLPKAVKGN